MITNKIFSIEKIYFEVFNFEKLNTSKSERERPSTLRDWLPCLPVQRDGGRRSRPGINPFISALTVARYPATLPGVWPQLRDILSTSRSVGQGTGAFISLPSFSENSPIFCSFPFTKSQPVFLPEQAGRKKHRAPFPPSATPAGITHYTLQAKSCAKGAHLQSSVFKLSKDLIDSIHEEGIVAYTS